MFGKRYFLANESWNGVATKNSAAIKEPDIVGVTGSALQPKSISQNAAETREAPFQNPNAEAEKDVVLPHRRRKRKTTTTEDGEQTEQELPLDASSQLSTLSSKMPINSFRQRFYTYLSLSKPRLSFLIVLTTTTAYSLFPVAISPFSATMNLSPLTLLNLTTGTALSCASANALNMLFEPQHDAKMSRTRNRPLVRGLITPRGALAFAVLTGAAGVGLLTYGVNPTVAFLSALNIFLYAGVYTPLKRISVVNTWVGALVGGIPPLMGWAAAAGQATTLENPGWRDLLFDPTTSIGGWLFAALLVAWQFPHFFSLAYNIRHEYAGAGYKMLSSINPRKAALVSLRYSLAMFPVCVGLSYVGVTGWSFVATSGVVNAWMVRESWRFWREAGAKGSARGLFWASVWHLPIVLVLAMVHKKGLWERFVQGGMLEEDLYEYVHEGEEERVPVERGLGIAAADGAVVEASR